MNKQAKFESNSQVAGEDISEIFRMNLRRLLDGRKIGAATLSRKAGLNVRAVKDIEERRAQSPRLSTVFKLAEALEVPPQELLGLEYCRCASAYDMAVIARLLSSVSVREREHLLDEIRLKIGRASHDVSPDATTHLTCPPEVPSS